MSSDDLITAIKAEIAALQADLRANPPADPRLRKIARLRETLAEYEPAQPNGQAGQTIVRHDTMAIPVMLNGTKQDKIKAELTQFFKQNGPTHRSKLLEQLKKVGLMGQEKDPMAAFAAYLSSWRDTFANDGSGLWGLPDQFEDAEEAS